MRAKSFALSSADFVTLRLPPFGNDGVFWMAYEDMLKRFDLLDRTRLFDADWTVVQQWTSASVSWVTGYLNTKFSVEIKKAGPTVFVLCQLDDRYFRGLSGKYDFDLHFVLQEKDATPGEYIVRARGAWFGNRSISAEVHLDVGTYEVLPKVEASRDADVPDVHDVVKKLAERNPQKLRQIGLNYDIANAKGVSEESEDERQKREKKRREDAEQKRREKEAEEKEKADFALWKKDERAEYELWKKERRIRDERERKRQATGDEKSEQASVQGDEAKKTGAVTEERNAAIENSESGRDQPSAIPTTEVQQSPDTETGHQIHLASRNSEECHVIHDHPEPSVKSNASTHQPEHDPGHHASVDGDEPEPSAVKKQDTIVSEEPKPWNAVCVLGLRVCSQDSEVSIKLVKPKDVEEGAILDVDGDTAAGATM